MNRTNSPCKRPEVDAIKGIPDLEVASPSPAAGGDVAALCSKARDLLHHGQEARSCAAYQLPLCWLQVCTGCEGY